MDVAGLNLGAVGFAERGEDGGFAGNARGRGRGFGRRQLVQVAEQAFAGDEQHPPAGVAAFQ